MTGAIIRVGCQYGKFHGMMASTVADGVVAHDVAQPAEPVDVTWSEEPLSVRRVVAEPVDALHDLAARLCERLAHLGGEQQRQPVGVPLEDAGERGERGGPLRERTSAPVGVRRVRGGQQRFNLGRGVRRVLRQQLATAGVDGLVAHHRLRDRLRDRLRTTGRLHEVQCVPHRGAPSPRVRHPSRLPFPYGDHRTPAHSACSRRT